MDEEHKHDRFLYEKDGELHFGCINPFCCHGSCGVPIHVPVPLDTDEIQMKLLSHKDRKIKVEVTAKKTNQKQVLECDDNLESCTKGFKNLSWKD